MARIDANVATQLVDTTRPQQTARDSENQAAQARRQEADAAEPARTPASAEEVRSAAQLLQQVVATATGRQLDFSVNDRFKEIVVKISDRKSGEVLKEIPSKDLLKLRERLNDLIGLFVDEKA